VNTDEVTKILREAFDAVKAAELPTEVLGVAMGKAVDLIGGVPRPSQEEAKKEGGLKVDTGDLLGKVAAKLGVARELVDDTYEVVDGDLVLSIPRPKLDAAKTKGTKQVALLVAAGRQAAGLEEWTETKTIRAVADDYGKFDSPNFASSVAELGDSLKFVGTGAARKVKVRLVGFEEAGKLITKVLGTTATT
jgi:hypothetical protein